MKKIMISKDWEFRSRPYCHDPSSNDSEIEIDSLDLPHDYLITQPRDAETKGGVLMGYFQGEGSEYTKYIDFGDWDHAILDVDGAYMCSKVYINEQFMYMHPHGYTPYLVDLTEKMWKNTCNRITINTQNLQPSSRWYSGAGLYRDVFLWVGGKIRIEPRDIFITTKSADEKKATVSVSVTVSSDIACESTVELTAEHKGITTSAKTELSLSVGKTETEIILEIENPQRWDAENPNLYNLTATVTVDGKVEDTAHETFGIRTIVCNSRVGLLINGKSIKLKGGCLHHDHGGIGAASFPKAEERKIKRLKDAGFNAIRTAHNPPSLALLEVCDRLGMYVMDEAFDMWNKEKIQLDYSLWFADRWASDIKNMVLRERNHPCVLSYSTGNEIKERSGSGEGALWSKKLADEIRKYDSTRLVTNAICEVGPNYSFVMNMSKCPEKYKEAIRANFDDYQGVPWGKGTDEYVAPYDIVGYNYRYDYFVKHGKEYPDRVIWGSESNALKTHLTWNEVMKCPHVIGDFCWTAYDNLGEAGAGRFKWGDEGEPIPQWTVGSYPWLVNFQGDIDLAGFRRPQSYFRECAWNIETEPKIFTTHPSHNGENFYGTTAEFYDVHETWTFEDEYIGTPVRTEVYSTCDEIRFILNGKDLGAVKPELGIAFMNIPYEKGELTAISYKDGKEVNSSSIHTIGAPAKVQLVAEDTEFVADNRDLCYVDVIITDANGDRVTTAEIEVSCEVEGAELMSLFSGHPKNEASFTAAKYPTLSGRAVAVLRSKTPGTVKITVKADGLEPNTITVVAK